MRRDVSAGGVLVRRLGGEWKVAVIRPGGRPAGTWVLPKGGLEAGESAEAAALREVAEETGTRSRVVAPLGTVRYWFSDRGERVLKLVSFFLLRYEAGRLGHVAEAFRHEVEEARWLPLEEAPGRLAYPGEREMAERAQRILADDQSV